VKKKVRYIIYLVSAILIVFFWEIASQFSNSELFISSPSRMMAFWSEHYAELLTATLYTFSESILGLSIAVTFSFLLMILCLFNNKLYDLIMPVIVSSQVIPLIVLAPLFIIIFGSGIISKVLMASILSFFPIFINFGTGIKTISPDLIDIMRVFHASKRQLIFKVYFPLSLPYIISGMKMAATLSVIGAIVAEMSGAEIGLGKNLFLSVIRLEPELMMNSLLLSAVIGLLIFSMVILYERVRGKWYLNNDDVL
jgi:NitT/TauT family transport system permease protein